MVAQWVKLTAQQLLSRNASGTIVGKDNHARDAMKYFYFVKTQPERSRKSLERRPAPDCRWCSSRRSAKVRRTMGHSR
jgi:hypothetical protein